MIESVTNEKIKNYAKLNDKKYRDLNDLFIIEGFHLIDEAIKKGIVKEIFAFDNEKYDNATIISFDVMKKLSSLTNPPKELAICEKINGREINGNIIILDDINNPGNFGTIIRSAVAFNYDTIIMSKNTVDIYNSKVIRATEGMLFNINFIVDDLNDIIPKLKKDNYLIIGTDVNSGVTPTCEKQKHALIIGSEARGISDNIKKICDKNLYIKMNPLCESLNAGVSASILMYELNRGINEKC